MHGYAHARIHHRNAKVDMGTTDNNTLREESEMVICYKNVNVSDPRKDFYRPYSLPTASHSLSVLPSSASLPLTLTTLIGPLLCGHG